MLTAAIFAALLAATRLPLAPQQPFSSDDVNFAWAVGNFDIRLSQPHPPGYPLFVVQMRALDVLHFKNARSKLLALALLGSLAAVLLTVSFGNRFFGGDAGLCAACLLVLYPSFWYAGVISAVRIQLAVVSLVVAAACWQTWQGGRGRPFASAAVLGLGAGTRAEPGALLFPFGLRV